MRLLPLALNAPISLIFIVVILVYVHDNSDKVWYAFAFCTSLSCAKNISTEKIKFELDRLI
jgi:hypothetical protein